MKNIYKHQLPKDKEVKNTNVRVENGEVIVEVELKDKFEPKDGDFLANIDGNVFIYSDMVASLRNSVCAYCGAYGYEKGDIQIRFSSKWEWKRNCRYATPEEKASFLKRLKEECHKRWNAEKKCLEDVRLNLRPGDKYYYVNSFGYVVSSEYTSGRIDESRISIGNCFKNEGAAQKVADQIKEIFKNSRAE